MYCTTFNASYLMTSNLISFV